MPHTFNDRNGNLWTVALTLGRVREVRSKFALDVFNENDWTRLMSSLLDRLTYVWWLCKEQADARNLSIDDFDLLLCSEDYAEKASDALLDELIFFYADLGQTKLEKLTKAYRTGTEKEREKFRSDEFEQLLTRTINGSISSTSEPSPESTGEILPSTS